MNLLKVVSAEIRFDDNSPGVFQSGHVFGGITELTFSEDVRVHAICMLMEGRRKVEWREHQHYRGYARARTTFRAFKTNEVFYSKEVVLFTTLDDILLFIRRGTYSYNFTGKVPMDGPTSFEGENGFIRYTVSLVLKRTPSEPVTVKRVAFTTLYPTDLNNDAVEMSKATIMKHRYQFFFGLCLSWHLALSLTVNQRGFVPGQAIPIDVTVTNNSRIAVHQLRCKLIRQVTYTSVEPLVKSVRVEKIVARTWTDGVKGRSTHVRTLHLIIPSLVPSTPAKHQSGPISVGYKVEVTLDVGIFGINPKFVFPVTIGTLPLRLGGPEKFTQASSSAQLLEVPDAADKSPDHRPKLDAAYSFDSALSGSSGATTSARSGQAVPAVVITKSTPSNSPSSEFPPPTFEETIRKGSLDDGVLSTDGQLYIPRYPVYRFDAAPRKGFLETAL